MNKFALFVAPGLRSSCACPPSLRKPGKPGDRSAAGSSSGPGEPCASANPSGPSGLLPQWGHSTPLFSLKAAAQAHQSIRFPQGSLAGHDRESQAPGAAGLSLEGRVDQRWEFAG